MTCYLGPLVAVADLPGRRALRSASTSRLEFGLDRSLISEKILGLWVPYRPAALTLKLEFNLFF